MLVQKDDGWYNTYLWDQDCVRCDLESHYAARDTNIFLDKCSFLDPKFKDIFSITDEPVEAVLAEAA